MFKPSYLLISTIVIFNYSLSNAMPTGDDLALEKTLRYKCYVSIPAPDDHDHERDSEQKANPPVVESNSPWDNLPLDIKKHIFHYVGQYELHKLQFARVNKECMQIAGFKDAKALGEAITDYEKSLKSPEFHEQMQKYSSKHMEELKRMEKLKKQGAKGEKVGLDYQVYINTLAKKINQMPEQSLPTLSLFNFGAPQAGLSSDLKRQIADSEKFVSARKTTQDLIDELFKTGNAFSEFNLESFLEIESANNNNNSEDPNKN